MKPSNTSVTGSATGASAPIALDYNKNPFNVSVSVVISATATYTVQYTFDGTNWFDHPNMSAKTTNAESNIAFPVLSTRVNVAANSGSVTMTVIQAGIA